MSFILTIPMEAQGPLIAELKKLDHVTLHDNNHPGHIVAADGTEFEFMPIAGAGQVRVTVTANPFNVSEDQLKMRLEENIRELIPGKV